MIPPLNLWRAEWRKTSGRPLNQILVLGSVTLLAVSFVGIALLGALQPARFLTSARIILPYPRNLSLIAQFAAGIGPLLATVFVATSVGSEYSGDAWKMLLPRYRSRSAFLLAKAGVCIAAVALLLGALLAVGVPTSMLGAMALGLPAAEPVTLMGLASHGRDVASTTVPMLLYGMAALFATVVTRSALAGAMVGFFGLQMVALLSPLYGRLALFMPYPHLTNITEHWVFRDPEMLRRVAADFSMPVSPLVSVVVIAGYCLALLAGAAVLFERRDLASG
jgi:ABC-type transport system involved in multi-copper enzyme maturation permease subunit